MKLQIKRSNVLEAGEAKAPALEQMEYGELAVNYNSTDPVIFIRDSNDNIIRLTNIQAVGDGAINVDGGTGLNATGQNATANQLTDTTRTLSVDTTWLNNFINSNGNGQININAGSGITATGSNATANQSGDTTRVISLKVWSGKGLTITSNGLRVSPDQLAGTGLEVEGDKLAVKTATGGGIIIQDGVISVDPGAIINETDGLTIKNNKISVDISDGNCFEFVNGELRLVTEDFVADLINVEDGLKIVNDKISVNVVDGYGLAIVDDAIRVVPEDLVDSGYGLEATTSGLRFSGPWTNIPALPEV